MKFAIDYNTGFTIVLAGLIRFGLGQRHPKYMLHFERVRPKLSPTLNFPFKVLTIFLPFSKNRFEKKTTLIS